MENNRIKFLRERSGYTHEEFAQLLDIGYATVYRYESGKSPIPDEILVKIADTFNVSIDFILGRSTENDEHLTDTERMAITAWRDGDVVGAIKVIVGS